MLVELWLAALLQAPCTSPSPGPLQTVCLYLTALMALDHVSMARHWSPQATSVNLAGVERPVDRQFMREVRDFERETHTSWTFQIDSVRGESVFVNLTESNDFYDLIGVGTRTQETVYQVRDGHIMKLTNTWMRHAQGEYGPAYSAFQDWLMGTEASQDPEIVQEGRLRFTATSAVHMIPWLKRYSQRPGP